MRHLRCVQVLSLTLVLLVITGCGTQEVDRARGNPRATSVGQHHQLNRVPRSTTTRPDVKGALTAVKHITDVLFATTTTQAPPPTYRLIPPVRADNPQYPPSYQPCDGEYPPCYRVATESGGDYNAYNATGCNGRGCYGKWQFSGEWACRLGLPCDLATATPAQQDEAARLLWNSGAGCSNWSAC